MFNQFISFLKTHWIKIASLITFLLISILSFIYFYKPQKDIESVVKETSQVRNLSTNQTLDINFKSQEELSALALNFLEEESVYEYNSQNYKLWKALRVIPSNFDLLETFNKYYTDNIYGFYHPSKNELYVTSKNNRITIDIQSTVAHEYTHYLQNQNFNLEALEKKVSPLEEGNEDLYQAYIALVEGDATFTTTKYISNQSILNKYKLIQYTQKNQPQHSFSVINRSIEFPYTYGYRFVEHLYNKNNSYKEINKAYNLLPESTEQILHPEKYLLDKPKIIKWNQQKVSTRMKELEEQQYQEVYSNYCMGEWDIQLMLESILDTETAERTAAGWDGNSTIFWYQENQDSYFIKSKFIWDSSEDLEEAKEGFKDYCNHTNHQVCQIDTEKDNLIITLEGSL